MGLWRAWFLSAAQQSGARISSLIFFFFFFCVCAMLYVGGVPMHVLVLNTVTVKPVHVCDEHQGVY